MLQHFFLPCIVTSLAPSSFCTLHLHLKSLQCLEKVKIHWNICLFKCDGHVTSLMIGNVTFYYASMMWRVMMFQPLCTGGMSYTDFFLFIPKHVYIYHVQKLKSHELINVWIIDIWWPNLKFWVYKIISFNHPKVRTKPAVINFSD